jgi:hypothetical protein
MTALRVNPARANRLLGSLPEYDRELLTPHLEPVELKFRQCLESANRKIKTVYFIDAGLASVVMPGVRRVGGHHRFARASGLDFYETWLCDRPGPLRGGEGGGWALCCARE